MGIKINDGLTKTQRMRTKRIKAGLCRDCGAPAVKNYIMCAACLYKDKRRKHEYYRNNQPEMLKRDKAIKARCKENKICPCCKKKLDPEVDAGHVKCVNCNIKLYRERGINRGYAISKYIITARP